MSRLRKVFALTFMAAAVAFSTTATASASTPAASPAVASRAGASTAGAVRGEHVHDLAALPAPSGKAKPDIGVVGCSSTSVMVYQKNGQDICFAYVGRTPYMALDAYDLWGGNNYGGVWYNYGYKNLVSCFGQWPSNQPCVGSNGISCTACGSLNWAHSPYWYAVINYIQIYGWGA